MLTDLASHASMGPRWLDRGKNPAKRAAKSSPDSFNGAAVVRPRKGGRVSGRQQAEEARFNGAAVVRPRKDPKRRTPNQMTIGFNGAAVVRPRKVRERVRIAEPHLASMGPQWLDRGKPAAAGAAVVRFAAS